MNTSELAERHHEACHPCDVQGGPAPTLVVTCRACGVRLEAALLSPCVGDRHDERVILMLECPTCGATGQLRMQRDAFGRMRTATPTGTALGVAVSPGGPGYLHVRCSPCSPDAGRGFLLHRHSVTADELVLEGVVLGCGHSVELRLPRTPAFRFEEHRHGPKPTRRAPRAARA